MNVLSVNVGLPREVVWANRVVITSIWKSPVEGPVVVHATNLDGDRQSDLSVHGGRNKAVYAYPSEHYPRWRDDLGDNVDLPWGTFGENLTTVGLDEGHVSIGDRLGIGSAEFVVTQPRLPCFKLGIRFGRDEMVKAFLDSGRSGFYLAVEGTGVIRTGDDIRFIERARDGMTIADLASLYTYNDENVDLLRRASELPALSPGWREQFRKRLADLEA